MEKEDFTMFDLVPNGYRNYRRHNGRHFTKRLCEFAVGMMEKEGKDGEPESITPMSKEEVEKVLHDWGIELKNAQQWDAVYVANMCVADFLGDVVPGDDEHLARFIKKYIDDPDGYEGIAFARWYTDVSVKGIGVPWEEVM